MYILLTQHHQQVFTLVIVTMLYFKELELAVVIDQDSKLMDVDEEDIKNENKKRDEADEADEKGFALSEEMKEDLILLVAIILILCLTSSIVAAKVVD